MQPAIVIENLRKNYGTKQVLKGVNLEIFPGQIIGYIGPNGAGKSTTVKILCGLINDYEGTVTVNGTDLKQEPIRVKSMIGYVPELAELYEVLTPREFLELMGQLYNVPDAVLAMRITGLMEAFGLGSNLDQRMDTFSKGMRQKVLIASGILHNPDILILDEPLSGLDANSVIIIKELISSLAREGKTIFYCSHMMDVVEKVSDRIVLINEGAVIANGTFEELQHQLGSNSLEKIFSSLTATESPSAKAHQMINLLENKTVST
ncbi:MAG: ABC transporter ATP-binding protein [Williamsia sp.]|nr:ABC transporter ATP-binding protein [Williamsia sp.]